MIVTGMRVGVSEWLLMRDTCFSRMGLKSRYLVLGIRMHTFLIVVYNTVFRGPEVSIFLSTHLRKDGSCDMLGLDVRVT